MISSHDEVRPGWKELGRYLLDTGAMTPDWEAHFNAVDRAAFLPYLMWPFTEREGHTAVSADEPGQWFRWADADVPITTQWDDGAHTGPGPGRLPTSSASMPSLVMSMLADLDVPASGRVLEIGTGTGWNAGLLVHRLGGRNVTTVEIDPQVSGQAQQSLHTAGLRPCVVPGDGTLGHRPNAPYDRVIVTCGVRAIAPDWINQTRTGGIVLAPWGTAFSNRDAIARLVVQRDNTAAGHFTRPAEFMKMRSQRAVWPHHSDYVPDDWVTHADRSSTDASAADFSGGPYDIAPFVTGLRVRDCAEISGPVASWFYGLTDRSWAAMKFRTDKAPGEVYQSGPRRLWDEVADARRWWDAAGRPGIERFGLTVDADGHHPWLDDPAHRI